MDKTHYERRSHEQGNYEITPTYGTSGGGNEVIIKSLATGQTMKVYLDEPTQEVSDGVTITTYEGQFYEEEFMVTPSEGYEITGLPLTYPYFSENVDDNLEITIDVENNTITFVNNHWTEPVDFTETGTFGFYLIDFQGVPTSGNCVEYHFTRPNSTSDKADPIIIVPGGNGSEAGPHPTQN